MKTKATKKRTEPAQFSMALEVCRMVKAMAEETMNCGICGEEPGHSDDCPYPKAIKVLEKERQ